MSELQSRGRATSPRRMFSLELTFSLQRIVDGKSDGRSLINNASIIRFPVEEIKIAIGKEIAESNAKYERRLFLFKILKS